VKDTFIVAKNIAELLRNRSFYSIFGNKTIWIESLKSAIQNPAVDLIGHLGIVDDNHDVRNNRQSLSVVASVVYL
jgi:hypothetical protein